MTERRAATIRAHPLELLYSQPADGLGQETFMIGLGIILLIVAVIVPKLVFLWGVGIILLVVGLILAVLGSVGHAFRGRRHYY